MKMDFSSKKGIQNQTVPPVKGNVSLQSKNGKGGEINMWNSLSNRKYFNEQIKPYGHGTAQGMGFE